MKILYFGGQKSGKSYLAEKKTIELSKSKPYYIATYDNSFNDLEMQQRVLKHQEQRKNNFETIEEPFDLVKVCKDKNTYLVDCLSMWLLNNLDKNTDEIIEHIEKLCKMDINIVFVLNDVTNGIIPIGSVSRKFVDLTGIIGQKVVSCCDEVYEVKFGLEKKVKIVNNISIFGTSSDAGKSTLTFVIGKLIQELGYKVAPFKAQNVSNNSHVCDDLSEIAIAQYFQADVLGVKTSYHLNPILLKSGRGSSASLIVEGKVVKDKDVREYYRDLDLLKPAVKRCFEYLDNRYDCIVAEGAGSPVELNLMDKDLSNIYIANEFNTKIILVADIEKGGVFASIWGVYNLLPKKLKDNVIGVIVNKFRGDRTLFDDGVRIIENDFKIPVLGVLPYKPLNLGFEDSASLKNFIQDCSKSKRKVAVISYPYMSNYNDFEPLIADPNTCVEFIDSNISLENYECVILPGSKLVIRDLLWLKQTGLFEQIKKIEKNKKIHIVGICGGYQMLFENIIDNECIEVDTPTVQSGFGFIDDDIVFQKEKVLKKDGNLFEIHHGVSSKYPKEFKTQNIYGTFSHGLFIDDWFENYKKERIDSFVKEMKKYIDIEKLKKGLGV